MTVRDYLRIIRERVLLILATVAVVTGSALYFSMQQIPQYTTSARLRVEPVGVGSEIADVLKQLTSASNNALTEAELVRSVDVASYVAEKLKLKLQPEKLLEALQVNAVPFTDVLQVTATWIDPRTAKDVADAFAEGYIQKRRDRAVADATAFAERLARRLADAESKLQSLNTELEFLDRASTEFQIKNQDRDRQVALIGVLQERYQALLDSEALQTGAGEIIQPAPLPGRPSSPNHIRNGILGFLVSLPLAVGLTLLRDSLSDTIKGKEEAEHLTGAPTLAMVPHDSGWRRPSKPRLVSREEPSSVVAEAYRSLRVNLEFSNNGDRPRYVLVTSPGRAEGKTATAANLAVGFAQAGRRTVLVSADMRRPRLHDFFRTERTPGLSDVLRGRTQTDDWVRGVDPNLVFVPSGSQDGNPDVRLGRREIETLFGHLFPEAATIQPRPNRRGAVVDGATSDIVLFDSPALLRASEVSSLAPQVDGVVLVLHVGATRRTAASRAAEQVRRVGGRVLGVVLIGVSDDEHYGRDDYSKAWARVVESVKR